MEKTKRCRKRLIQLEDYSRSAEDCLLGALAVRPIAAVMMRRRHERMQRP
jgi:hypothetical protein